MVKVPSKNTIPTGLSGEVDTYLAALPAKTRAVLENLRRAIKAAAPRAEEMISYRIPTYKYHGPLVHFMAGKNHCSFIVVSKATLDSFPEELKGFKTSGTTIHFTPEKPLPANLIKKIIKTRLKENEAGAKNK